MLAKYAVLACECIHWTDIVLHSIDPALPLWAKFKTWSPGKLETLHHYITEINFQINSICLLFLNLFGHAYMSWGKELKATDATSRGSSSQWQQHLAVSQYIVIQALNKWQKVLLVQNLGVIFKYICIWLYTLVNIKHFMQNNTSDEFRFKGSFQVTYTSSYTLFKIKHLIRFFF